MSEIAGPTWESDDPMEDPDIPCPSVSYLNVHFPSDHLAAIMSPNGDFSTIMPGDTSEHIQRPTYSDPWREVSKAKKAEREARLAQRPEWRLKTTVPPQQHDVSKHPTSELTPRELEIVRLDVTAISEAIRTRQYGAVETLKAFCHVASIAQDLTNCLTEVFFDEGLRRAQELDRYLEETGQVVGPLHGVPVSIKDHVLVKGHDTATGYIAWAGHTVAEKDAVVVDILRRAGAVIYVKTANPQTLLVCLAAPSCNLSMPRSLVTSAAVTRNE